MQGPSPDSIHGKAARSAAGRRTRRVWAPYVVLVLSLILTAAAAHYVERTISHDDRMRLEEEVNEISSRVGHRLQLYVDALTATASLFATRPTLTATDFRRFTEAFAIRSRYPGIQGLGFTETVRIDERDAFLRKMREQQHSFFEIWPSGNREVFQPVTYLEPLDARNQAALGYDMWANESRRRAMSEAARSGLPHATGPVVLAQEIEGQVQPGFLIYVPIFTPTGDPNDSRERLLGFAYGAFRTHDLIDAVVGLEGSPAVHYRVLDGDATGDVLYDSQPGENATNGPEPEMLRTLHLAGRTWTLSFTPSEEFFSGSRDVLVSAVLLGGVFISLVFFGVVFSETRARSDAEVALCELEKSEEALRLSNQAKDEFLAMLGHELRNPLAATQTALEVLRDSLPVSREANFALEIAERQVRHQTRLVDDLLDAARVSRGRVVLRKSHLDLRDPVARAVETLRPTAENSGRSLRLVCDDDPIPVHGDSTRLEQIVSNLVTNAIKYTESGGHVDIEVKKEGSFASIVVRDDGIGIEPEALKRVFELFAQEAPGIDRSKGGLGIGLTLAARLLELHDGSLEAKSEGRHRGSEFRATIPLDSTRMRASTSNGVEKATRQPPRHTGVTSLRVLLVEDNEDTRVLLEHYLKRNGYDAESVCDGERAIARALETRPDVALVDLGLPGIDGFEVGRQLRESLGRDIVLLAVSGYGREEDRRRSLDAGFDRHLLKPVEPRVLLSMVERLANRSRPS